MEYIIICVIILLILIITIMVYSFFFAFYSNRKKEFDIYELPDAYGYDKVKPIMKSLIKEMNEKLYEEIYIISYDGIKLFARYYHLSDNAPLQIQCHGYRGCGIRDFCGGNKLATKLGYNTLVIDQRAHGKSQGNIITFGIKERMDILYWINYCNQRFGEDKEIVLAGVSMGASSVLMTLDLDLPKNVKAVIADCPYSSPKDIIIKLTNTMKFPGKILYPLIYLGALIFGNVNLNKTSAKKAIKKAKIPVLLLHGDKDDIVPYKMSVEIQQSNLEMCQLEIFENAGHGISYIGNEERYTQVMIDFINKIKKV